jgi:hypothetical protein
VLVGGREDVEDAAAHRELAALGDQVDPRVRHVGEPPRDRLELGAAAGGQLHRLEVAEALELRLEQAADRRDDHLDRSPPAGWARRRSTASRRPTVSERGESRSCGSVSQDGKTATRSGEMRQPSASARSSASRLVAVTASTGRPAPPARPGRRRRPRRTGAARRAR